MGLVSCLWENAIDFATAWPRFGGLMEGTWVLNDRWIKESLGKTLIENRVVKYESQTFSRLS
jgi:hypothetical protein